jgi:WD40 repeat protein
MSKKKFIFDNLSDDFNYYLTKIIINYLDKSSLKELVKTNILNKNSKYKNDIKKIVNKKLLNYKCTKKIEPICNKNEHVDPMISYVKFNHDCTKIIYYTCIPDEIIIYDLIKNEVINVLKYHKDEINSIDINFDGSKLVSGSDDKKIYIWDINKGKCILTLSNNQQINSVQFNNNSKKIVSANNKNIYLWNINEDSDEYGKSILKLEGHTDYVMVVGFNYNSTKIFSGSDDNTICIWNVDENSNNYSKLLTKLIGHTEYILSVDFNYNSTKLVSSSDDKTIRIWNINEKSKNYRKCILILEFENNGFNSVKFNNDGTTILSGSDKGKLIIWNIDKKSENYGKCILDLEGHYIGYEINSVEFNNNNTKIVSGSEDYTIRIWDLIEYMK